ncbi:hypothetical protein GIB67_003304 [Kingdonia uniflora]|uniref:Uncharacterized protein n=1 Tax=Kingdonia uniflora TaxID=39325 RepID=A0A7J7P8S2_9MAGN|nr:hypothetical protein GIB67_003304 [Kingdonia uniflora]
MPHNHTKDTNYISHPKSSSSKGQDLSLPVSVAPMEGGGKHKRGLWTLEEDKLLMEYIREHGNGRWSRVSKITGLKRGGKSCRLRWINNLSLTVKKGNFSKDEEDIIIRLHKLLGNRWSLIAGRIRGRTGNQIKNHWNTHLSKKFEIKKERTNPIFHRYHWLEAIGKP